ncbi:MAG TPA: hypothetical protein VGF99_19505 [Myxococcota bacterium]
MIDNTAKTTTTTSITPFSSTTLARATIPRDVLEALQRELADDEHVVWQGQPIASRRFWPSFVFWIFAVPWTAFSVFWTVAAAMSGGFFGLFGVPFVLVGCLMLSAPWYARWSARHSIYAVSNHRLLVIEGQIKNFSTEWATRSIRPKLLERRHRRDGTGSLIFERTVERDSEGDTTVEHGFKDIDDVVGVEAAVRRVFTTID